MSYSVPHYLITPLLFGLTLNIGCGETAKEADCGGHGEMHGDHCDCDAGYSPSEDGLSCEPSDEEEVVDYGGDFEFNPSDIQGSTGENGGSQSWLLEAVEGDIMLTMEIYEDFGGISSPGELEFTEIETNYKTCGTCILVQTGCSGHGDHYHCSKQFMPKAAGKIRLDEIGTAAGETFSGELLGVIFQEVTIAFKLMPRVCSVGSPS